jgi:hypothetical protein
VLNESTFARPSDAHNGDDDVRRAIRIQNVSLLPERAGIVNPGLVPQFKIRDFLGIFWRVSIVGTRPIIVGGVHF